MPVVNGTAAPAVRATSTFVSMTGSGKQPCAASGGMDTSSLALLAMTEGETHVSHSRARIAPIFAGNRAPHRSEGAGNAGCALHRRSRAQWRSGCAHEHTGSAEAPGIPCVMVLRLMPRSPRRRIRLVTVVGGCKRLLNPVGSELPPPTWHQQRVSGPHGFAVRSNVVRLARLPIAHEVQLALRPPWRADALASTTSHPAFVTTRDRPSCWNGTAGA